MQKFISLNQSDPNFEPYFKWAHCIFRFILRYTSRSDKRVRVSLRLCSSISILRAAALAQPCGLVSEAVLLWIRRIRTACMLRASPSAISKHYGKNVREIIFYLFIYRDRRSSRRSQTRWTQLKPPIRGECQPLPTKAAEDL